MGHDESNDSDHHDETIPLYCPPVQRQNWGEAQMKPHTNWGDTFFDLFYVAGAYNLGTLLKTEPTSRGFLYFISCFFPLQILWIQKMFYDSRFAIPHDDVFHRMYEFAGLVLLATAVLYIRPVSILADPTNHIDMFCFSLSIALAMILGCGRAVELYVKGIGQPALKSAAKRDVFMTLCPLICYIAAAFVSGLEYYDHSRIIIHTNTTNDKSVNDNHYYADNKSEQNSTSFEDVQDRRVLAAEMATNSATYDTVNENNLPIYLILAGGILFSLSLSIMVLTLPGGGKHKEIVVPMNVTFGIHRWGEFTMLMLGESVLSLLIVDISQQSEYYSTFFCGIISISLLEFLHFRSQPHDPDDHALRRSKEASVIFTTTMQIYSASLVVLGTSFKMFQYEYVYKAKETGNYRLLENALTRLLAASDEPMFDADERQQRIAHFFCISMAVVWLCSDIMIINHRGLKDNVGRCRFSHTGFLKFVSTFLILLRLGLVCFMGTLSLWVTQPSVLVVTGLVGIVVQVLLRVIGSSFFGPDFDHNHGNEDHNVRQIMKSQEQ